MDFDYSDDQKFLKGEARRFLAAHCSTEAVRRVLDDPAVPFDRDLWAKVAEQGWLGASIPEAYGGLGLSRVDLCAIAEELGRACAPIPFSSTVYFVAEALLAFGSKEQKARWLPRIAAGEAIGAVAFAERPGAITPRSVQAKVAAGRLSGTKLPVTDGDIADLAVVLAIEGDTSGLFLVDMAQGGITRETLTTLDPTRSVARLGFDGVAVERLGGGDGFAQMQALLDRAAVPIAFEQVGGADRCLDMARDYALQRQAFGRPIGGNQAVKHKLADIYVKNQIARSNAYYAAWALDGDATELPLAAATARVAACDAYWFAAKENIEAHGGIGFTGESDCHLHYRRCRLLAVAAGSPRLWNERIVAELERSTGARKEFA